MGGIRVAGDKETESVSFCGANGLSGVSPAQDRVKQTVT